MSNPEVEERLREGIKAARAKDKATARSLLERVVELDQHNEKGWFWLASVVDNVDEKRVCLGNVIVINPDNRRAQRLLDKLEGADGDADFTPGGGSNTVYIAAALGVLAVLAVVLVLVLGLGDGDDDDRAPGGGQPANTQPPDDGAAVESPVAPDGDAASAATPTPVPPTEVPGPNWAPTWTPVPSPTPYQTATPLATVPPDVGGQLLIRTGLVFRGENQQIALVNPDGSSLRIITQPNEYGHMPIFAPDDTRYAYIQYNPGTSAAILLVSNFQGTEVRGIRQLWPTTLLANPDYPAWSPDGRSIAFIAIQSGSRTPDLYVGAVGDDAGTEATVRRLTEDQDATGSVESWPAFSPDSQRIVYTARFIRADGTEVTELRIYNLATDEDKLLTTNGNALIEAAPDWSPDGRYVIFQATEAGAADNDIYRVPVDDPGAEPEKLIDFGGDDIQPRYSPVDPGYIVFSSDRTGNWDVFVYDLRNDMLYQVTTSDTKDVANDWGR
jgi:Tol biopolymer transport system component